MNPLPTRCPVCGGELVVTRLHCPSCETTLEGSFVPGASPLQDAFTPEQLRSLLPFARLSQDQLYFVLSFVRCEGRFNRMEEELGLSYPTLRGRLDEIIRALGFEPAREEGAAREYAAREIPVPAAAGAPAVNAAAVNLPNEAERQAILDQLSRGEINLDEAKRRLRGGTPISGAPIGGMPIGEPPQGLPPQNQNQPLEPTESNEPAEPETNQPEEE